jgi:hypothetical protein
VLDHASLASLNKVLQQGRANKQIKSIFLDQLLPCVIDCQVIVASNDSTLCTFSDKAYAIYYLKRALMVGFISINYKRVRLQQSKVKNDLNLGQPFQLSTQRMELYMINGKEQGTYGVERRGYSAVQ